MSEPTITTPVEGENPPVEGENPPVEEKEEEKPFLLRQVLPLLAGRLNLPRGLDAIIRDVLDGEDRFDLRRAFKRQLQRRVTAQEGKSGAELLTRSIVKQIDFHYEVDIADLSLEERHRVISELAENVARQLVLAAKAILEYPTWAKEVNRCKFERDVRGLADARRSRTLVQEDFRRSLVNSARAAVGDDIVG